MFIRLFLPRSRDGVLILQPARYLVVKNGKLNQPDKQEVANPLFHRTPSPFSSAPANPIPR